MNGILEMSWFVHIFLQNQHMVPIVYAPLRSYLDFQGQFRFFPMLIPKPCSGDQYNCIYMYKPIIILPYTYRSPHLQSQTMHVNFIFNQLPKTNKRTEFCFWRNSHIQCKNTMKTGRHFISDNIILIYFSVSVPHLNSSISFGSLS